ncbi:MAG: universal stress protein [Acidobacteria bacterium]|nr:universal stress protein [Acidobacteriota bacterium]
MPLPTSILCPIDFSAHSERALRHALAIAGAFGGHLTVVTINDPVLVAGADAAGYGESLRDQVEAALQETLGRMPAASSPLLPAIDIVTGVPADEILAAAERAGADLIVMGTRGLGGAGRLLFGSTTERVVRAAHVPVLVIPEYSPERMSVEQGTARFTLGQVVAAVGLDAADTTVAAAAAAWAAACGVPLAFGHVCLDVPAPAWWPFGATAPATETNDATRAQLEALARTVPGAADALIDVRRGNVQAGIAAIVRDRNAGLLVVSRGGGQHRLGATAYRVMTEADVPTLVVAGA